MKVRVELDGLGSVVDFKLPEGFTGYLRIWYFCCFALIFVVDGDKWAVLLPAGMQLLRAAPGATLNTPVEPEFDDFVVDCLDGSCSDFVVTLGGRPFVVLLADVQEAIAVQPKFRPSS